MGRAVYGRGQTDGSKWWTVMGKTQYAVYHLPSPVLHAVCRLPPTVVTSITAERDGRHIPRSLDSGSLIRVKRVGPLCRYYLSPRKAWRTLSPSQVLNFIGCSSVWRVTALRASLPPPLAVARSRRLGVRIQHTPACIRSHLLSPTASFPSDVVRFSLLDCPSSDAAGVSLPQGKTRNPRESAKIGYLTCWDGRSERQSLWEVGSTLQIRRCTIVANRGTKNGR